MEIERTSKEILLRISPNVDEFGIKKVIEYIDYLELTSNNEYASQKEADQLAEELNENWWNKNKDRFLK